MAMEKDAATIKANGGFPQNGALIYCDGFTITFSFSENLRTRHRKM